MPPSSSFSLSTDDRRALLIRARRAIEEAVCRQAIADFPAPVGRLAEPGSAFVTVFSSGRLRGCVGRVDRTLTLAEAVVHCAIGAVTHDTRFRPLQASEIDGAEIEISVLSVLRTLPLEALEVGTHGLLVTRAERRGVLLPQVAAERRWSVERFREETCKKAGLDSEAWRDPETKVEAFTAEVFSEADFSPRDLERSYNENEAATKTGPAWFKAEP
jgi:AmmeMemoRadiSam system protein A